MQLGTPLSACWVTICEWLPKSQSPSGCLTGAVSTLSPGCLVDGCVLVFFTACALCGIAPSFSQAERTGVLCSSPLHHFVMPPGWTYWCRCEGTSAALITPTLMVGMAGRVVMAGSYGGDLQLWMVGWCNLGSWIEVVWLRMFPDALLPNN